MNTHATKPTETFDAHGYTWTRHTPGDPMPCEGEEKIYILLRDDFGKSLYSGRADSVLWCKSPYGFENCEIIGWRYTSQEGKSGPGSFSSTPPESSYLEAITTPALPPMSTTRPTPETDAAIQSIDAKHFRGKIVAPIFAAKLERERDEARETIASIQQEKGLRIEELKQELDSLKQDMSLRLTELEAVERERDEARESVRCRDLRIDSLQNDLMTLRDELKHQLKDAREDAERLYKELSNLTEHICECDEESLLACDSDPHPPSVFSGYAKTAMKALAAHETLTGGKKA